MKKFFINPIFKKNQKGIALLLAMVTMTMVAFLATELSYETNVEYIVNSQAVQRIKAYYSAKSAMELSLLRVKIYSQVKSKFGQQLGNNSEIVEMIWNMPFAWPPLLPEELNAVDKGLIEDKLKESNMDTSYIATISDEGSKIDINDLNSPSKPLIELTKKRLLQLIENKKINDEKWAKNNPDIQAEQIVNALQDWTSSSQTPKTTQFASTGRDFPPNRSFRTVDEIRLIPGMTEAIFEVLKDNVTVYGMKAINPNQASKEVIMSLDPGITPEVADKIIERRNNVQKGGPFNDAADFWTFASTSGARVDPNSQQNIPLIFDSIYNFRIKAIGNYKNSTREITAIVYDLQKTAQQISDQLKKQSTGSSGGSSGASGSSGGNSGANLGGSGSSGGNNSNNSASKGPPRIVYWNER